MEKLHQLGIDIGSTTVKYVLLDGHHNLIYGGYKRHHTEVFPAALTMLEEITRVHGDLPVKLLFTGTAGMGVSERSGLPFVQEVSASAEVVKKWFPEVRTFIDLGGEDTKIIFFDEKLRPDIRMNGNCAGGTGAFIDQMASLLDIPVDKLSDLAEQHTSLYTIASRCGVFAKTDVQNLMSRGVSGADIAASIYRSVALQVVGALARGRDIRPKVLFAGGPFAFQPALKMIFAEVLHLADDDIADTVSLREGLTPDLIPATGAALRSETKGITITLDELKLKLEQSVGIRIASTNTLEPLFTGKEEYRLWEARKSETRLPSMALQDLGRSTAFLGIDSGSTTTKIVLTDSEGRLAFTHYAPNRGNSVKAVQDGLKLLRKEINRLGITVNIVATASTGYGEDLIQFAYSLDQGYVETMAHYRGARFFEPEVSFILDIGGQDMKAMFIAEGVVKNIELNESCSSGCGSFIQTFASSMEMKVEEFARHACESEHPYDLGSRCTVFMNSKVKQVLREGGSSADISAGLAFSVIKNCLNKVLKVTDTSILGNYIVVQGGTFKNPAVLRAFEKVIGKEVIRPDRAELMGAWGAALLARDSYETAPKVSSFIGLDSIEGATVSERRTVRCKGCENLCEVTVSTFPHRARENGKAARFYSGNKCEQVYSNSGTSSRQGRNLPAFKRQLIFSRPMDPVDGVPPMGISLGIPRVLNIWEDFPFWCTLFTESGIQVVLSDPSTQELAEKGYQTVMSENICFPAKITNGHIFNLMEKGVDRIFYPKVRYTRKEFSNTLNTFNCPVVTGYPQVIESAVDPEGRGVPYDAPPFSFHDRKLLRRRCMEYLTGLGVAEKTAVKAFKAAQKEMSQVHTLIKKEAEDIILSAAKAGHTVMLLVGRPYHIDPMIHMKIPEIVTAQGFDCITEDAVPAPVLARLPKVQVLTQWGYPNRMFYAAHWAGSQLNVEVLQTNSFGCGPDALTVDEIKAIMNQYGKNPTVIKIDEMTSPGSVKLRIRSLVDSMALRKERKQRAQVVAIVRKELPIFTKKDMKRTVIAPQFSPFYTDFIIAAYRNQGYSIEVLPMGDHESIKLGLRYSNSDICYPATIVIGDVLKALRSGNYDLSNIAVGLTQTGGQCRASSYVSLMKQALLRAGYDNIPVVTASTKSLGGTVLNEQPGFRVKALPFTLTALYGMLFGDVMAKLYYYCAVREKIPGSSMELAKKYIDRGRRIIDHRSRSTMMKLLHEAIGEFNQLELRKTKDIPRVGIVGEIYVKFNPFGNLYITDWLIRRSIQPEVPPLIDFFLIPLVSTPYNAKNHIERVKWFVLHTLSRAENYIDRLVQQVNTILGEFNGELTHFHSIKGMADRASQVIDLINQFGESWLLAGDIVAFAEEGIENVVCLQPFGCIANHVIAKGVERKLKTVFPQVNLLFLDMDSGMSEVNVENRMEFLVDGLVTSSRA